MSELKEAIAAREKEIGRPLSAAERLTMIRKPVIKDDEDSLQLALDETLEGQNLRKEFDRRMEFANVSSGVGERHKTAHWWESEKRKLVAGFENGEIERTGPAQE